MTVRQWLALAIIHRRGRAVFTRRVGYGALWKVVDRILTDADLDGSIPVRSLSGSPLAEALKEMVDGMFGTEGLAGDEACLFLDKVGGYGLLTYDQDGGTYRLRFLSAREVARRVMRLERALETLQSLAALEALAK